MLKKRFGWKRQPIDHRDYHFRVPPRKLALLPAAVDLAPNMPPADDQGDLGACGPNSVDVLLQYDQKIEKQAVFPTSRLTTYWFTRYLQGDTADDTGVDNRTMLKALNTYGFCQETLWPYNVAKFAQKPPAAAIAAAALNKITSYAAVTVNLDQMRGTIASGFPFLFGADVYQAILSDQVAATGIIPMPKKSETPIGGHDVAFVGYDDKRRAFKFEMPWGKSWGLQGYGWWPYDYATDPNRCGDFWVINAVPGAVPTPPPPGPVDPGTKAIMSIFSAIQPGSYVLSPATSPTIREG